MAKKPSVRYWDSRGGYGCWIDGTQHILAKGPDDAPTGATYLAALGRFKKLLAMEAEKGTDDYLVSSLLNQYRIHLQDMRSPRPAYSSSRSGSVGLVRRTTAGSLTAFGARVQVTLRGCSGSEHIPEYVVGVVNWATK